MMTRAYPIASAFGISILLSACQPAVPDSGRGVGFDTSYGNQEQRNAALVRSQQIPDPAPSRVQETTVRPPVSDGSAEATAAETQAVLAATRTSPVDTSLAAANSGVEPVQASPANPAPQPVENPGISDENDFDAVASRQTIESDRARIDANSAQYEVVQPEALPTRGDTGDQPNIVAYALQTQHPKGQKLFNRGGFNKQAKFERNCAAYTSPDQAQIEFLSRGGPERDRKGLDPDGDGFACGWDPSPFRKAANG